MLNAKMSVPTLEKKHHKWFLRFTFEEDVKMILKEYGWA